MGYLPRKIEHGLHGRNFEVSMDSGFLLMIGSGVVTGLIFSFMHIPGGAMLGAVVGSLACKFLSQYAGATPPQFQLVIQLGMGVVVGNMMTASSLAEMKAMLPLMIGTTAILIVAGFAGAYLIYRATGMDIPSAILATSPGGLQAVVGLAADMGNNAPAVMAFQVVRLYAVLICAPAITYILHLILK